MEIIYSTHYYRALACFRNQQDIHNEHGLAQKNLDSVLGHFMASKPFKIFKKTSLTTPTPLKNSEKVFAIGKWVFQRLKLPRSCDVVFF